MSLSTFAKFSGNGTGEYGSPYQVETPAQLDELRNCLKPETYIKLMNDIDLTDYIAKNYPEKGWLPINCSDTPVSEIDLYGGVETNYVYFDGGKHTISGLKITGEQDRYSGLFSYFAGEIKDLTVDCDIDVSADGGLSAFGAICGLTDGADFKNCKVTGTIKSNMFQYTGGLCGYNSNGTFEKCEFNGKLNVPSMILGGIAGTSSGGCFTSCDCRGEIVGDDTCGGIVGKSYGAFISGCHAYADIKGLGEIGGIVGYASHMTRVENSSSSGNIKGSFYVGGIVGTTDGYYFLVDPDEPPYIDDDNHIVLIHNCGSGATVSGTNYVGGIIGGSMIAGCTVDGGFFDGSVAFNTDYSYDSSDDLGCFGGIAGLMNGTVCNCMTLQYSDDAVSGTSYVGGLVGYLTGKVYNCYTHGYVNGDNYVGGICGYAMGTAKRKATIYACCNFNRQIDVNTTKGEVGRIVGHIGDYCDIPSLNSAKTNRSDIYYPVKRRGGTLTITDNLLNGRSTARSVASEKFFYEDMGWDMNVWHMHDFYNQGREEWYNRFWYPYPSIRGELANATYGYHLRTENAFINKSAGGKIKLIINNSSSVYCMVGAQFDIQLPKGVSIKKKANGQYDFTILDVIKGFDVSCSQLDDGSYRFIVYSSKIRRFDYEGDGLLSIALEIDDAVKADYYDVIVKNVIYSQLWGENATEVTTYDNDFDTYNLLQISGGLPGDVNNDGILSVIDVMMLIDHILEKTPDNFYKANADTDGNGSVSVTDVMRVVDVIVGDKNYKNIDVNSTDRILVSQTENGIDLQLDNSNTYSAFQMNVKLPEGLSLTDVVLNSSRSDGHKVARRQLDDGSWNILVWSAEGKNLKDQGADLLKLVTTGNGNGEVEVSGIIFTNHDYETVSLSAATGEVTSINGVAAEQREGDFYDLNGVRVKQPGKGVYVHDGKKVILK